MSARQTVQDDQSTVTVRGTGTVERAPERAVVNIAVEVEAASAASAASLNASAAATVIAAIRATGVAEQDVRTISYRLDPIRSPRQTGAEPRIVSYRATNMVRVVVDPVDRIGAVLDAAVGAGANRVTGVAFELRDPEAALTEALELAMGSARRQAEALARAAGMELGNPLSINASDASMPMPMPMQASLGVAEIRQAPTPIEPGTLSVMATVHVTYRIR